MVAAGPPRSHRRPRSAVLARRTWRGGGAERSRCLTGQYSAGRSDASVRWTAAAGPASSSWSAAGAARGRSLSKSCYSASQNCRRGDVVSIHQHQTTLASSSLQQSPLNICLYFYYIITSDFPTSCQCLSSCYSNPSESLHHCHRRLRIDIDVFNGVRFS